MGFNMDFYKYLCLKKHDIFNISKLYVSRPLKSKMSRSNIPCTATFNAVIYSSAL